MLRDIFYGANSWEIVLALLLLISAASEIGFRLGRKSRSTTEDAIKTQISVVEGALIGVLVLLFRFTMSMAVGRFGARRQQIVDEANAIGTSWLRTQLLPEPERSEIANLLREYVDVRVQFGAAGGTMEQVLEVRQQGQRLQEKFGHSRRHTGKRIRVRSR